MIESRAPPAGQSLNKLPAEATKQNTQCGPAGTTPRALNKMSDAPDCSPDGPVNLADDEQQPTEEVGVVGDTNLGVVMLALLVMGLINYSMRDPCTC